MQDKLMKQPVNKETKRYVVGLLFNDDLSRVVLIKKNRPQWQVGKANGVGGKIEEGESPLEAMVREYKEEAGVQMEFSEWEYALTLHFEYAEIIFFTARNTKYFIQSTKKTDESILKVPCYNLQLYNPIENIPHIMELCKQRLTDHEGVAPCSKT